MKTKRVSFTSTNCALKAQWVGYPRRPLPVNHWIWQTRDVSRPILADAGLQPACRFIFCGSARAVATREPSRADVYPLAPHSSLAAGCASIRVQLLP